MQNDKAIAVGQIASLKASVINSIMHLREEAERARDAGDGSRADQLEIRSLELAKESVRIYRAELAVRQSVSLKPKIAALRAIADDGRKGLDKIRKVAEALQGAADVVGALGRLTALFP